jgi:hypothetical protein
LSFCFKAVYGAIGYALLSSKDPLQPSQGYFNNVLPVVEGVVDPLERLDLK